MTITHEQKADIGVKYTEAVKDRIAHRTDAQTKAKAKAKASIVVDNSPEVLAAAAVLTKKHRIDGEVAFADIDTEHMVHQRTPMSLRIRMSTGAVLSMPIATLPRVQEQLDSAQKAKALSEGLCGELEFLHGMLAPARVGAFQAHAARLWAPAAKEARMAPAMLKQLVEDFLTAARPNLCQIA